MAINHLESKLEAITVTIAQMKKSKKVDEKKIKALEKEREEILKELKIN